MQTGEWSLYRLSRLLIALTLVSSCCWAIDIAPDSKNVLRDGSPGKAVNMTDGNYEALLSAGQATDVWVIHVISEKQAEYHGTVWNEVLAEHWSELGTKYKFATVEYEGDTSILLTKWCIWRCEPLIRVLSYKS